MVNIKFNNVFILALFTSMALFDSLIVETGNDRDDVQKRESNLGLHMHLG